MNKELLDYLGNTTLKDEIEKVESLYKELEEKEKEFTDEFNVHCLKGCGKCCEHFTPDITTVESDYLAYGIIKDNRVDEIIKKCKDYNNAEYCPLFDKDNEYHCTVYKYRPLICRLFGACASQDKLGNPIFKNCKWNKDAKSLGSTENMLKHKDHLIMMEEYGLQIDEIRSGLEERDLLPHSLLSSIEKIEYIVELEKESEK